MGAEYCNNNKCTRCRYHYTQVEYALFFHFIDYFQSKFMKLKLKFNVSLTFMSCENSTKGKFDYHPDCNFKLLWIIKLQRRNSITDFWKKSRSKLTMNHLLTIIILIIIDVTSCMYNFMKATNFVSVWDC